MTKKENHIVTRGDRRIGDKRKDMKTVKKRNENP